MFPSHDLSCRSRSPPAGCVFPCKSTSCLESLSSASPCLPAPCFHPERRGRRGSSAAALRLWAGSPCRSLTSDSESHYALVIHSALVSNNFLFLVLCLTSSFFFFFPPEGSQNQFVSLMLLFSRCTDCLLFLLLCCVVLCV